VEGRHRHGWAHRRTCVGFGHRRWRHRRDGELDRGAQRRVLRCRRPRPQRGAGRPDRRRGHQL